MSLSRPISTNQQLASEIRGGKLSPNTKKQYERKYEHFKQWIKAKYPIHINTSIDDIILEDISDEIILEFFAHICRKRKRNGDYSEPPEFLTYEYVSNYKSALKNYYKEKRVQFSLYTNLALEEFFQGYERKIAALKRSGEMSLVEGKQPLSFSGYKYLCTKALRQETNDLELTIFAHLFLTFSWNLLARCNSVATLMLTHITWEEDSMVIVFPSHKGDQEGRNSAPKHVFANPTCPEVCPVLSLAIYIFCMGWRRGDAKSSLFGGIASSYNSAPDIEKRFSRWLKNMCLDSEADLLTMGILIAEIGTHSFRKGIASFLASIPGGPSAIAIYLRAGWSLGAVQMRYILNCEGGD
jgi:hypothetical protein